MSRNIIQGTRALTIAASIEEALLSGRLEARLPPIRELAAALHVSPVTVAAAYRLLRTRGLVVGGGRGGTRVRRTVPSAAFGTAAAHPLVDGVVDLASGTPDPDMLPSLAPALRELASPRLPDAALELPALASFAFTEFRSDGILPGPIAVTHGTLDAVERVLRDHTRPGDRVGVEDPAFPSLVDTLLSIGLSPEPIEIDQDGSTPEALNRALSSGVRVVIVSSRAQNPTGAVLGRERANELSRLLRRCPEVLVVEIDDLAAVAGVRATTLTVGRERWALVKSTAMFLGSELRLSVVTGDESTIARLRHRQSITAVWVPHVLQELALALWSDPSSGRRFARAAGLYAARRTALVDALAGHGIAAWGRSGFNVWIPVREETATVMGLATCGWAVCPGERFRQRTPPAIRVTTSVLDPHEAVRFAADLAAVVRPRAKASGRGARAGSG